MLVSKTRDNFSNSTLTTFNFSNIFLIVGGPGLKAMFHYESNLEIIKGEDCSFRFILDGPANKST